MKSSVSAMGAPLIFEKDMVETVLARCAAVAAFTDQEGMILRTFLSPAMERCHLLIEEWMKCAGMQTSVDRAGNLRGVYESSQIDAPRLILASHLDSVPHAGRYDGILGVILGIALIESLQGSRLPFVIEVIGFSDEEGVRYGLPFIGSRALTGELSFAHRQLVDADGIALSAALDAFASAHPHAIPAEFHSRSRAYLEFHIEQGPLLEDLNQALGVVEAIAGQSRATFTFRGRAGHAGTTPMALRRDAMTAAAEWILAVEATATATPGLVASTGRIVCEPGAGNIIPGFVRCSLDLRSKNDELRKASFRSIADSASSIATRRKVEASYTLDGEQATVPMSASLTQLARQSVAQTQSGVSLVTSGAGHDAMMVARHLPSAMIFLRSPGGVSHHPDETVLAEDVAAAIQAGIHFLSHFASWIEREDCA